MDNSALVNTLGEGESMSLFELLTPHGLGLHDWIFVPAWDEKDKLNLVFISYSDTCVAYAATEDSLLLPVAFIADCGDLDELPGDVVERAFLMALGLDEVTGQLAVGITSRGGPAFAQAQSIALKDRDARRAQDEQEAAVH